MQTLDTPKSVAFAPFVLDLSTRTLLAHGEKVTLSSRGFDILALLAAEHDRVVGKDEIIGSVWHGLAVEENNLAVQVSALRRALAEHADGQTIILTVPGQGYRFVAKLDPPAGTAAPAEPRPFAIPTADQTPPAFALPPEPRHLRWPWALGALAVAVAAVAAGFGWQAWTAKTPPRLSIAVLPFRNLSDDRSQDYLADAISDDLTTDLAHLPGSVVIARESSDVYKGHAAPAQQIGRTLNVRYLLEGSLRPVENTFSVNAQLIDASDGSHLWASQFTVPRDKLRDAQSLIVGNIGSALHVRLMEVESARSIKDRPNNPDAEDLLLRGRSLHDHATDLAKLRAAQNVLEQALEKSPSFVPAITELAQLLIDKILLHDDPDEDADFAKAEQLASRALELAPNNDNALAVRGWVKVLDWQLSAGEASFQTAIGINPNNVQAHIGLVSCAFRIGKPEAAVDALQEVLRLDPQSTQSTKYYAWLGYNYFILGNWNSAIDWLNRSLAESTFAQSDNVALEFAYLFLVAANEKAGHHNAAQELYAVYQARWQHRSIWRMTTFFYKPLVDHPGFKAFSEALQKVGMPIFAKPYANADVSEARQGDFDPAPSEIPGSTAIGITDFQKLRHAQPPALIIDVDQGAAMIPEAKRVPDIDAKNGGLAEVLSTRTPSAAVVIIGGGWYGWSATKATRRVVKFGVVPVFWLRGGEEALAASGDSSVFNARAP